MTKSLIILIVFTFTQYSFAQNANYKQGDTLKIFALSGLKLRNEGNINSKVLSFMKFGEKVIILDTSRFNQKNVQIIEGFSGRWIKIKYDTIEGYAFDGYLSSLPIPKINLKKINDRIKTQDSQLNDYNESRKIEWALMDYINTEFYPIGKPIKDDNGIDGEQHSVSISQKISHGLTKINGTGWENYGFSLEMPNIRLSEIKNLILVIATKSGLINSSLEKIKDNVQKIKDNIKGAQPIFNIPDFNFDLNRQQNKNGTKIWYLGFDRVES